METIFDTNLLFYDDLRLEWNQNEIQTHFSIYLYYNFMCNQYIWWLSYTYFLIMKLRIENKNKRKESGRKMKEIS